MYKAHSKDINRNKSFHPLTFGNLSKVERIKEKEAAKKEESAKRQQELLRDQEERRYHELVNAGLGSDASGDPSSSFSVGGLLPVKRVFAAEYAKVEGGEPPVSSSSSSALNGAQDTKLGGFIAKFQRATTSTSEANAGDGWEGEKPFSAKRARDGDADGRSGGHSPLEENSKRARCGDGEEEEKGNSKTVTGFVTTSEAAALRKEYELLRKQKVDPLRKVREYQNKTIAAAAAAKSQPQPQLFHDSASSTDEGAIRDRVRKLMELSRKAK